MWKKKGSVERNAVTKQLKTSPQRSGNVEAKLVRSPHVWKNKFVSYKPSFSGYCFSCKDYGHRADECKMRSRNKQSGFPKNINSVCNRCNAYGYKTSKCRNLHMLSPGYANKSSLDIPINKNVICYNYNGIGHRSHEFRNKKFQSYGSRCNNHAQYRRGFRTHEHQILAWNKRRNVPGRSRNPFKSAMGYNCMVWRRRSSNHLLVMNIVCYYNNVLDHVAKSCRARTNKKRQINNSPKTTSEKRSEIKQVWRKKPEEMTMDRNCAFKAQVISPKA